MNQDSTDHDHADGCLCGLDHDEHDETPDIGLPAARGGVAGERRPRKIEPLRRTDKKETK